MNAQRLKFKIPIAIKLVTITSILLVATAAPIAFQASNRFEQIAIDRERSANMDQSLARANEVEGLLLSYIDKIKVVASVLFDPNLSPADREKALALSFEGDRDLVAVEVRAAQPKPHQAPLRVVNQDYLENYSVGPEYIDQLRQIQLEQNRFPFASVFAEQIEVRNSSLPNGAPLITIGVPLVKDDLGAISHVVLAEVRLDRLQKVFANINEREIFLVDRSGLLLAHPNEEWVLSSRSLETWSIVNSALGARVRQGEERFLHPDTDEAYRGAYTGTAFGVSVVAAVSEEVILEAARQVRREAIYIAGRILSVALFLIFIFSMSLTAPIEKLADVTEEVAKGNFAVKSNVRSRDEVGELARSFDQMIEGLQERDKVKNLLNKFHGSTVTEDLLKGDVQLGGSRKDVTVFFSDIRDFTKFSEGHTPEEVVDMLNEYFQIMVGIINRNQGIVDKFIGDAIMAVWGAPHGGDRDAHNAVKACLEMRQALAQLNELRVGRGQVPIRIGMGLHSGDAISGTIGSDERMEYTVIGDSVNQASRIEASTKAFGTDLLLSDAVAERVGAEFMVEEAGRAEVKGKSKPLIMYKVRGFIDEKGNPQVVQTEYSDYAAEAVDKVKVA